MCGIPGERHEDYIRQMELFRKIWMFTPPNRITPVRIDRYSPYFCRYREFGWEQIRPYEDYRMLHPEMDKTALERVAYHFKPKGGGPEPEKYIDALNRAVSEWKESFQKNHGLFMDPRFGLIRIGPGGAEQFKTDASLETVLSLTNDIIAIDRLLECARVDLDYLDSLEQFGILYREENLVINLAVNIDLG